MEWPGPPQMPGSTAPSPTTAGTQLATTCTAHYDHARSTTATTICRMCARVAYFLVLLHICTLFITLCMALHTVCEFFAVLIFLCAKKYV